MPSGGATDRNRIALGGPPRLPARVTMHREVGRHSLTLLVEGTEHSTGAGGSHHHHVRGGQSETGVEEIVAVCEHQARSPLERARELGPQRGHHLIGEENGGHRGVRRGSGERVDREAEVARPRFRGVA